MSARHYSSYKGVPSGTQNAIGYSPRRGRQGSYFVTVKRPFPNLTSILAALEFDAIAEITLRTYSPSVGPGFTSTPRTTTVPSSTTLWFNPKIINRLRFCAVSLDINLLLAFSAAGPIAPLMASIVESYSTSNWRAVIAAPSVL